MLYVDVCFKVEISICRSDVPAKRCVEANRRYPPMFVPILVLPLKHLPQRMYTSRQKGGTMHLCGRLS